MISAPSRERPFHNSIFPQLIAAPLRFAVTEQKSRNTECTGGFEIHRTVVDKKGFGRIERITIEQTTVDLRLGLHDLLFAGDDLPVETAVNRHLAQEVDELPRHVRQHI